MRNRKGSLLIACGTLLLAAALGLTGYNLHDQRRAAQSVASVMAQLETAVPKPEEAVLPEGMVPDYVAAPQMQMPAVHLDSGDYIGIVTIPALELELPVMGEWSYPNLKQAPCCYSGSVYTDDMVICAHNYTSHFGPLPNLQIGDEVYFTDIDANRFRYQVVELEQLAPEEAKRMRSGDWDLSLFTCTVGGRFRVTVRCEKAEP